MKTHQTPFYAVQFTALAVGFMIGPIATPALIWLALALDLPLAVIIVLLIVMVVMSDRLSHLIIRAFSPTEADDSGRSRDNATAG